MASGPEKIVEYLDKLENEMLDIESQVMDISLFGLGGVTWSEAWTMSSSQRVKAIKKLNDYYEKKSGNNKEYLNND